uniref:Myb-like transcription factor-like n=1 Tax=Oryza sativa subsp. japonica TaxID=39947 RepID=Q6Z3W6_ORYSJ|nr:Myb-like transcription factor-like [Oryza sativa Japonica Group]
MDQEVIMATPPLTPPPRARCVVRLKLLPAWTPEEDARLQRLAKENGFRRWSRVARSQVVPRQVAPPPRPRHDELLRLHYRLGDRWKEIGRAVYGRTSRVMKHRWRELRRGGFPAAATRKEQAPAMDADDMVESEMEDLAHDHAMDPLAGSLALGFACMAV